MKLSLSHNASAPTSLANNSSRNSTLGTNYFRSTSFTSQGSDNNRQFSATERLEADKLKYVKSAQARRRRTTTHEFRPSVTTHNLDSTGTHSSGSDSTSFGDDYDIIESKNKSLKNIPLQLNFSVTDAAAADRTRIAQRKARPRSLTIDGLIPTILSRNDALSAVRLPRSDKPSSSDSPRSTSLKPSTTQHKVAAGMEDIHQPSHCDDDVTKMSPRSQLRHVRQSLKKVVKSPRDENSTSLSSHDQAVKLLMDQSATRKGNESSVKFRSSGSARRYHRTRPFSVIENIKHFEEVTNLGESNGKVSFHKQTSTPILRNSNKTENFEKQAAAGGCSSINPQKFSEKEMKRESLDLFHAMEASLQLQHAQIASSVKQDPLHSGNDQEIRRKSCPRDLLNDRVSKSILDEGFRFTRSVSRKNLSSTFEKMHNADPDDDMDTAYSSMSPDVTSTGSKTVIANPSKEDKQKNIANLSINDALNGKTGELHTTRSLTSKSFNPRSCTRSDSFGYSSYQNSSHFDKSLPKQTQDDSTPVPVDNYKQIAGPPDNLAFENKSHNCLSRSLTSPLSQPLNRIDRVPSIKHPPIFNSPMLAPRARKEIAPDYSTNGNPSSLSHNCLIRNEYFDAIKPQMSTSNFDNKKPYASCDLKSRDVRSYSIPVKDNPQQTDNNEFSKLRNNGLLSVSISTNNQPHPSSARSTSSTPYSSLKRLPTSSKTSSLKRNRQRSRSDINVPQNQLDHFFATMGMDESIFTLVHSRDLVSSESDFSFAGASAYVRDGPEDVMEVDPVSTSLANLPTVSVIEKNARVMRWIMSCKKSMTSLKAEPSRRKLYAPTVPPRPCSLSKPNHKFPIYAPPVPPRSYQTMATMVPIESDV